MMRATLLEKKYKSAKTLPSFVQNEIVADGGKSGEAIKLLAELLGISADARAQIAIHYVEAVHDEMREAAAEAAKKAKYQALDEKNAEIKVRVNPMLQAIEAMSAEECQKYEEFGSTWRSLDRNEKRMMKDFSRKLGLDHRKWKDDEWRKILRSLRWRCIDERRDREEREEQNLLDANERKVAAFDRMVMALDALRVGNKVLGDCTGGDLLREAARLEALANQVTAQSVFYRQLAAIVGKAATVREASDRAGIVGLLTSRYKEESALAAE